MISVYKAITRNNTTILYINITELNKKFTPYCVDMGDGAKTQVSIDTFFCGEANEKMPF